MRETKREMEDGRQKSNAINSQRRQLVVNVVSHVCVVPPSHEMGEWLLVEEEEEEDMLALAW